jgi:hypothetical protein
VVRRGLAREPSERFESCREFAEAFAGAVQAEGGRIPGTPARGTGPVGRPDSESTWSERRHGRWGHAVTLGALLAVAVGVFLFLVLGGKDPEEHGGSPGPSEPAAGVGATRVVLVEPGAEPRRVLRYRVTPGDRIGLRMTNRLAVEMKLGEPDPDLGEPPDTSIPEFVMECDVSIEDVAPEGRIDFLWEVNSIGVSAVEGDAPTLFSELEGTRIRCSCSPTGIGTVRSIESEDVAEVEDNPILKSLTSGLGNGIHEVTVPLPEEPVGIGARWEVTRTVTQMKLRLIQTTIYELTGSTDDTARIHVAVAQTATEQKIELPGVPSGAEVRIASLHAGGSGDVELRLTEIVPVASSLSMKIEAELEVRDEEESHTIEMDQRLESGLERR